MTLYNPKVPSAAPLFDYDRKIISIDGGCVPVSYTHLDVYKRQVTIFNFLLSLCHGKWRVKSVVELFQSVVHVSYLLAARHHTTGHLKSHYNICFFVIIQTRSFVRYLKMHYEQKTGDVVFHIPCFPHTQH